MDLNRDSLINIISSKRFRAVTLAVLSVFMVLIVANFAGTWYITEEMPDPVNQDAEYPEDSFEVLWSEFDDPKTEHYQGVNPKEIEGSTLKKRLLVSGKGLLDVAIAGSHVMSSLRNPNGSRPKFQGRVENLCAEKTNMEYLFCDHDSKYVNVYSTMYKGWMRLGMQINALDRLYENKTAMNHLNAYIRRAEFYDSYLDPEGFEMKPVEAAYYTSSSGIYIIGSGKNLKVNGDSVDTDRKGTVSYSNISLNPGYHSISSDNYTVELLVHHPFPVEMGTREEGYQIVKDMDPGIEPGYYDKIRVINNSKNQTFEITNKTETIYKGETPEKIYIYGENGRVPVPIEISENRDRHLQKMFGMSKKELERFRKIASYSSILPGIQKTERFAKMAR